MLFETCGDPARPAVLFFRAMGVTGASSEPVARALQLTDRLADQPFPALPEAMQRRFMNTGRIPSSRRGC